MKFSTTPIEGAVLIEPEPHHDERGFFARTYCEDELAAHGLVARIKQASVSSNRRRGTLRGMHVQAAPHEEIKLVSVQRGAVHDVLLDLRPASPSYRRWHAVRLDDVTLATLYIPGGVAHGFQTLADDTVVSYRMSVEHHPAAARGVRFDDPAFAIRWPEPVTVISERDRTYPDFEVR